MSQYVAERQNSESTTIIIRKKIGDRIAKKIAYTIELDGTKTFEEELAIHGLEMVGSWMKLMVMGADAREAESVDIFPIMG